MAILPPERTKTFQSLICSFFVSNCFLFVYLFAAPRTFSSRKFEIEPRQQLTVFCVTNSSVYNVKNKHRFELRKYFPNEISSIFSLSVGINKNRSTNNLFNDEQQQQQQQQEHHTHAAMSKNKIGLITYNERIIIMLLIFI